MLRVRTAARLAALALAAGAPATGCDDGGAGSETDAGWDAGADTDTGTDGLVPYPPARDALIPLDGQVLMPVLINEEPETRHMVVDTGAVRTLVDEALVPDAGNGVGDVTIDFGEGVVLEDYEVLAMDLSEAENHIGVRLDGLIGQDLFGSYFFGLDYRASQVAMGPDWPTAPAPTFSPGDEIPLPYDLVQGYPIVDTMVGDTEARLIADTGSGVTLLTESMVDPDLLEEGIEGYVWYTSYGSDPGVIVRVPSIEVGGHEIEGSWAAIVPDDHHLSLIFDMLGIETDGFLGYPVYRRFYVSVFGADSRYDFFPYPDLSHVPADEWSRVGIELMREAGETIVDMVFSPSDAADEGIQPGDVLVAVDGSPVDSLALDEVRLVLRGEPGAELTLDLVRGETPVQATVQVDELLPPL